MCLPPSCTKLSVCKPQLCNFWPQLCNLCRFNYATFAPMKPTFLIQFILTVVKIFLNNQLLTNNHRYPYITFNTFKNLQSGAILLAVTTKFTFGFFATSLCHSSTFAQAKKLPTPVHRSEKSPYLSSFSVTYRSILTNHRFKSAPLSSSPDPRQLLIYGQQPTIQPF